jgi:ATP-dependent helicase HrpA
LPIDPRLGRMILAAREENCMDEVLIIAAALSVQDPRERPLDKQQAADAAHAPFRDENSDFVGILKLWHWYVHHARHLSTSKLRKLCQANFLSFVRLREWRDIHQQLHGLVAEMGLLTSRSSGSRRR